MFRGEATMRYWSLLPTFLFALSCASSLSLASDYSGVWKGKTIPQDPECGFSESFKLVVRGENFEAISKDVTGARSLSGKIKNGKIKQSINWGITIDQENQDADDAKLIGGFVDGQKFVGEINAYGVRVEDNRDYPVACSLNLEVKPEKVVNAKKRTIKKEDLNSIKILLRDGLITQEQFDALKKKIENKDKPAAKKPYDPDLEKKLESIAGLYERKLISRDEYETMRKQLLGLD